MDIHEYQAKQLLSKFGVVVPPGEVVYQTHEAENIVSWLNEEKIIVKAQVHAGGRGKAGGVKLCKNNEEVVETVDKMIGMKIITPQTSEDGKIVRRVYLEKGYEIENVDSTILLQEPHVSKYVPEMKMNISKILETDMTNISVKATTTDHLGFIGSGTGISANAIVLVKEIVEH